MSRGQPLFTTAPRIEDVKFPSSVFKPDQSEQQSPVHQLAIRNELITTEKEARFKWNDQWGDFGDQLYSSKLSSSGRSSGASANSKTSFYNSKEITELQSVKRLQSRLSQLSLKQEGKGKRKSANVKGEKKEMPADRTNSARYRRESVQTNQHSSISMLEIDGRCRVRNAGIEQSDPIQAVGSSALKGSNLQLAFSELQQQKQQQQQQQRKQLQPTWSAGSPLAVESATRWHHVSTHATDASSSIRASDPSATLHNASHDQPQSFQHTTAGLGRQQSIDVSGQISSRCHTAGGQSHIRSILSNSKPVSKASSRCQSSMSVNDPRDRPDSVMSVNQAKDQCQSAMSIGKNSSAEKSVKTASKESIVRCQNPTPPSSSSPASSRCQTPAPIQVFKSGAEQSELQSTAGQSINGSRCDTPAVLEEESNGSEIVDQLDPYEIAKIKQRLSPQEKYSFPATTGQQIGWFWGKSTLEIFPVRSKYPPFQSD